MTTITFELLAEIKAKAEKATSGGYETPVLMEAATTLALVAALEEARRERDHWRDYCDGTQKILEKRSAERDAIRAENEKLRAALEPFASRANLFDGIPPPKYWGDTDCELRYSDEMKVEFRVGDLRRARAALKEGTHADNHDGRN